MARGGWTFTPRMGKAGSILHREDTLRIAPLFACVALSCAAAGSAPEGPDTILFRDACDGSAAAALPGGLFVGANDETNLLRVYRMTGGRPVAARSVSAFLGLEHKAEADIEGAASIGAVTYWIASHSRGGSGEARPARARLFATRWDGREIVPVGRARRDLRAVLTRVPALSAVAERPAEGGGINIEGLADGGGGALLMGFRSPLRADGRALVLPLADAAGLVGRDTPVRLGAPMWLDLGGRGVRSLERIGPHRWLIVAGPARGPGDFALFTWGGRAEDRPRRVVASLGDMVVESAIVREDGRLMLFSDDGSPFCKSAPRAGRRFRGRVMAMP